MWQGGEEASAKSIIPFTHFLFLIPRALNGERLIGTGGYTEGSMGSDGREDGWFEGPRKREWEGI